MAEVVAPPKLGAVPLETDAAPPPVGDVTAGLTAGKPPVEENASVNQRITSMILLH